MWLLYYWFGLSDLRKAEKNLTSMVAATVVGVRDNRYLSVQLDTGAELIWQAAKGVAELVPGERVWLSEPAESGALVTVVTGAAVINPRGMAATDEKWA